MTIRLAVGVREGVAMNSYHIVSTRNGANKGEERDSIGISRGREQVHGNCKISTQIKSQPRHQIPRASA